MSARVFVGRVPLRWRLWGAVERRFRSRRRRKRESLVAREQRLQEERVATQGWDKYHLHTVTTRSLSGADAPRVGTYLYGRDDYFYLRRVLPVGKVVRIIGRGPRYSQLLIELPT